MADIRNLSNEELREELLRLGMESPGPIGATTRTLYEAKLRRLLNNQQLQWEEGEVRTQMAAENVGWTQTNGPAEEPSGEEEDEFEVIEETFEGEESYRRLEPAEMRQR